MTYKCAPNSAAAFLASDSESEQLENHHRFSIRTLSALQSRITPQGREYVPILIELRHREEVSTGPLALEVILDETLFTMGVNFVFIGSAGQTSAEVGTILSADGRLKASVTLPDWLDESPCIVSLPVSAIP